MNRKRIYISGPITGVDNYMDNFIKAHQEIQKSGYDPVDPAAISIYMPGDCTHDEYMNVAIQLLLISDYVYMLKGWERSEGAREEFCKAIDFKKTIIFEK